MRLHASFLVFVERVRKEMKNGRKTPARAGLIMTMIITQFVNSIDVISIIHQGHRIGYFFFASINVQVELISFENMKCNKK